jgi:hypothetical protein
VKGVKRSWVGGKQVTRCERVGRKEDEGEGKRGKGTEKVGDNGKGDH